MKQKMFFVMLISTILSSLLAGCSRSLIPQPLTPVTLPSGLVIESGAVTRLDAKLSQMTADGTFTGSVLIAVEGKTLLNKGYGLADRLQKIPNTPQTRFHLGSTTKSFTAMGILILQSQGKLSVQDPICKYITECPLEWQGITIHHLLTHTSGLSAQLSDQLYREIEQGASAPLTPAQLAHYLGLTSPWSIDSPLGEQYSYNNFGYILLAYIIEVVSGQSYGDYLDQAIFIPLNMRNSGYPDSTSGLAKLYANANTKTEWQIATPPVSEGSGNLYSSAEDLLLLDQALYTDQLLPQVELDRMFGPYSKEMVYGFDYGYGWVSGKFRGQQFVAGAGGGAGSPFGTMIVRFTQDRLTIIVLANQNIDQIYFLGLISDELFGKK
jgi:CubicO group peptidase (beta-lactamase class C family)